MALTAWAYPIHAVGADSPNNEAIGSFVNFEKLQKTKVVEEPQKPKQTKPKTKVASSDVRPTSNERVIGQSLLLEYGWENQWTALDTLWTKESGWQAGRLNHSSFACGIPQALPCTKIYSNFAQMERITVNGKLFLKTPDAEKEIRWGLNYIKARYGTPTKALQFHRTHNWY